MPGSPATSTTFRQAPLTIGGLSNSEGQINKMHPGTVNVGAKSVAAFGFTNSVLRMTTPGHPGCRKSAPWQEEVWPGREATVWCCRIRGKRLEGAGSIPLTYNMPFSSGASEPLGAHSLSTLTHTDHHYPLAHILSYIWAG